MKKIFACTVALLALTACTSIDNQTTSDTSMLEKRTENMDREIHELKEKIDMLEKRTENMDREIHELKER